MSVRAITIGVMLLLFGTTSAAAQQRGTVEFGGFASNTSGNSLGMNDSWGAGGRIGAFLYPRLSVEFEGGATSARRDDGLRNENVGVLSGRVTATPVQSGRVSFLIGAGIDHTDSDALDGYGPHGLVGARVNLWGEGAARLDGIQSSLPHGKGTNRALHLGLTFYRNPFARARVVRRTATTPALIRPDSFMTYETRRLRAISDSYSALRDSLAWARVRYVAPSSAEALAMMREMIFFKNNRWDLSDSAKRILDDKVTIFRANPAMRIVISGFASEPGTETHNMALGLKRAEAAKAYLVSQGVDALRIEVATRGEGQLAFEGSSEIANAPNRRGQFRLLIADPYLAKPRD
ncbi:MAG TPA: OmpA family protein [Gemmatimonadaceae bacterium]|nr:OmpA family protein [Gemmatimonadaceae bacterium]